MSFEVARDLRKRSGRGGDERRWGSGGDDRCWRRGGDEGCCRRGRDGIHGGAENDPAGYNEGLEIEQSNWKAEAN